MSYTRYPSSFQCPKIIPYAWSVDMGILRTPMEGGNARQRRRYRVMPHAFRLEFILSALALGQWQTWINSFAYDWFLMDLQSMWSAATGNIIAPHIIRFTSDLEFEDVTYGWVRCRVGAELSPNQYALGGPLLPTYAWVIAGTPLAPSLDGWVIAGDPTDPSSPDWIYSGTPQFPAAIIF